MQKNMSGQKTDRRPKRSSQDVFRGNVHKSQSNDGGEIVAYSEVVYLNNATDEVPGQGSSHSNAAHTAHQYEMGNATPSINGFVRKTRNHGKVTAIIKDVYKANDGGQLREESGTLVCNGVVQGLIGPGRTTEPVKAEENRATKAGKSREHSQINANNPQPKN